MHQPGKSRREQGELVPAIENLPASRLLKICLATIYVRSLNLQERFQRLRKESTDLISPARRPPKGARILRTWADCHIVGCAIPIRAQLPHSRRPKDHNCGERTLHTLIDSVGLCAFFTFSAASLYICCLEEGLHCKMCFDHPPGE